MRADAARNTAKVRAAAAALFQERGFGVSLKDIAREANVSHGTIYNLFGGKDALIDEVVEDLTAVCLAEVGERALSNPDPWQGFVSYVEELCAAQRMYPAVADVVVGRYPGAAGLMRACASTLDTAERVLSRARESGQLRSDFSSVDLALLFSAMAHLSHMPDTEVPAAWRRFLHVVLDGLRSGAVSTLLPPPGVADCSVYEAIGALSAAGART